MRHFLLCGLVFLAPPAMADWQAQVDRGANHVEFDAVGKPSLIKIHGASDKGVKGILTLKGQSLSGVCSFRLDTLTTGLSTRDEHMKEKYLEVPRYPVAKLEILPVSVGSGNTSFNGKLSLHGVDHPVQGTLSLVKNGGSISLDLQMTVKQSDFQIAKASFAGITVKDDVAIKIHSEAPIR